MVKTKIGTATVVDGEAILEWTIPSNAKIGTSNIYGVYLENSIYMRGESYNTIQIRIGTTCTVENVLASTGENATFTARVKHSTNQNVDEGSVQFQLGGVNIGSPVNVSQGVATLQYIIPSNVSTGTEIRAYFIETNTYGASISNAGTLTIRKGTNVTVTDISANRTESITITGQVTDKEGNNVNTGVAKLYIDETLISSEDVTRNGTVSFNYTVANNAILGSHVLKIIYEQNNSYEGGQGTGTLIVRTPTVLTPVNVSVNAGNTCDVTIRVTDENGITITTGTINFTIGETSNLSASVNQYGEATYQYEVPQGSIGYIEFSGQYIQDTNYQGSSTPTNGRITIRKSTVVTVDSKKANVGDTINLSATVTSGQELVDEGSVDFEIE